MNKNLVIGIFFALVAAAPQLLFSRTVPQKVAKGNEAWRYMILAQKSFDDGDYGSAFSYAEKGKNLKKADCDWQVYQLESLMKKSSIRAIGNDLNLLVRELKENNLSEALNIIQTHLDKKGTPYFKNDYSKLFDYVSNYYEYPEADFLIAKIYELEGENEIALDYLGRAYSNSEYLDVAEQKYDILNELAKISFNTQDYDNYEKYLLLSASDNKFFSDNAFLSAITNLISDNDGAVEKFFLLYRCTDFTGFSALIKLADYYKTFGRSEKALKCSALASIIAVSRIDGVLSERLTDYEYKNFSNLLTHSAKYSDIVKWGNENDVWKLFYEFADICALNGKFLFARTLYSVLSEYEPEEYWKNMSSRKLIK